MKGQAVIRLLRWFQPEVNGLFSGLWFKKVFSGLWFKKVFSGSWVKRVFSGPRVRFGSKWSNW